MDKREKPAPRHEAAERSAAERAEKAARHEPGRRAEPPAAPREERPQPKREEAQRERAPRMRGTPLVQITRQAEELPELTENEALPKGKRAGAGRQKDAPEKRKPAGEKEAPEKKKPSLGKRLADGVISLIFMCVSVLVLAWVGINVHPDSGSAASASAASTRLQLSNGLDAYMNNLASDALGDLAYIKKLYTIQESYTSAPAPDETKYGSASIDNAQEVMEVVQRARDMGLLDGQEMIFNPDIDFYYDSEIKYYCDETILVICWKEVIDGNTCSCVEVKIADASQFRRKIADDTYGSSNQYHASTLAKQANAAVAMNADFYQFRNFGVVVYQRELYRYSDANYTGKYSMYNCIDNCFVTAEGDFLFMHKGDVISEEELRRYIEDNNILFSIAFGPILVEDGQVQSCDWYPAGQPTTGYSRAGIGIYDELHYFYMNLNHSPEKAARWTVDQFAQHMAEKGVNNAYGLDGGQTGEIVFRGEPYNYIDFGSERLVSDIIYFATAIPEEEAAR